jgi:lipopolysaccharide biosynthesis glycosyltransferase
VNLSLHQRIRRRLRRYQGELTLQRFARNHSSSPVYDEDTWCFLIAADRREPFFSRGTLQTIRSLQQTNPNIPIAVAFSDLDTKQIALLGGCKLFQVDAERFNAKHRPDIGTTSFLRFYAQDLPYSRVVYVDSDTVVTDSLAPLFRHPSPVMARDYDLPLALEFSDPSLASARLRLADGFPLFNAGLMAFSVPYLRKIDALGRCQTLAREFGWEFFLNPDQSMWIAIAYLTGGFGRLPPEYNFMTWSDMAPAKGKTTTSSTGHLTAVGSSGPARVLHWVGGTKPWHFDKHNFSQKKRAALFEDCYLQFTQP